MCCVTHALLIRKKGSTDTCQRKAASDSVQAAHKCTCHHQQHHRRRRRRRRHHGQEPLDALLQTVLFGTINGHERGDGKMRTSPTRLLFQSPGMSGIENGRLTCWDAINTETTVVLTPVFFTPRPYCCPASTLEIQRTQAINVTDL